MTWIVCLGIGLTAGVASGVFGIGGAVIIVPLLISILGYDQKTAQGTTLVMLVVAPSMIAAFQYYKNGYADINTAIFLWIGVFIGSGIGAWLIHSVFKDSILLMPILKKTFAAILVFFAVKMWFS